ncbi:MAG: sigma-54-dependent Fis family transcriptional regulator [Bacteroidetes bacterium]|nr:MAG: sigma-54-dependent Fis family transcriptional regulator [Bacteroidota bacterium]
MTPQEIQSIKQRFSIIGNSPQLNYAIQVAAQVASTNMTVLIAGESGTGKESFSKIIHQMSSRKHGQFIAVNCGAIPEGTIDSELFGHEKGSFTGASDARKGYFEVTDGGTIFLDEIGEMPLGTQARLLRILENGEYIRVGSSKVQKTDARVVAATNVNLIKAIQEKRFREDLYYRLNTVPILVPSLRDRGEDVYLLFRKFASDFSDKYKVDPIKLTREAQETLSKYRFPGNIRQLKNIVDQVSLLEISRDVGVQELVKYLPDYQTTSLPSRLGNDQTAESFTDKELIFKFLFDMKRDLNDLKGMVLELVKNPADVEQIISSRPDLFVNVELPTQKRIEAAHPANFEPQLIQPSNNEISKIEDVSHVEEEENLSIIVKEKELIIKALKKYNGKRKLAADDLGISERTLYRKLKEYDLEHL